MKVTLIYGTSVLSSAEFDWDKMITKKMEDLTPEQLADVKNGIKYMFTKNESAQRSMAETYATMMALKMIMEGKDPDKEPLDITAKTIREWYEESCDVVFGEYTPPAPEPEDAEALEAVLDIIDAEIEAMDSEPVEIVTEIEKKKAIEA